MSLRTRRTASIGVAVAALALTSACGGGSSSHSSTGATPSAGSTVSASASTPAGGDHLAPGASVDAASMRRMFTDALAAASTVHVSMTMTGGISMSGSGDLDLKSRPLKASLKLTSPQLSATGGETARMLLVDNAMYLQLAALGDKYVKASLDDKTSPLASLGLDSLDPGALFDRFGDAIAGGTYVGKDTVEGTATDHYRFTIDGARLASALPSLPSAAATALPAKETVDVWFDGAGRYRQMKIDTGGESVTEVFSDWGKKVSITAPPASKVTDMSGLAGAGS
jgi:hypothetical protein